jgi:SAM-dependent methyltransferase
MDLSLLIDLHKDADRQGPGGMEQTLLAMRLAGILGVEGLTIADLGCGTGASTRVLAGACDARIVAVDMIPAFLQRLQGWAEATGLQDRIKTCAATFEALPLAPESFDVVWSEGAIYNLGFEAGLRSWRPLLRPGGVLVVSDLTWLTGSRPEPLETHWAREYPEVATAADKMERLEVCGYSPLGYFPLPPACWLDNYYDPLEQRLDAFLARHDHSAEAHALAAAERVEIDLYRQYQAYVSYGVFIARRTAD